MVDLTLGELALRYARAELEQPKPTLARRADYFAGAMRGESLLPCDPSWNYCAAAASWCLYQAAGELALPPEELPHLWRVSGLELEQDARARLTWLDPGELERVRPGDVVITSRGDPGSWTRHVGRVEHVHGRQLTCIDANAAGGRWQRVERHADAAPIVGFVAYPAHRLVTYRIEERRS